MPEPEEISRLSSENPGKLGAKPPLRKIDADARSVPISGAHKWKRLKTHVSTSIPDDSQKSSPDQDFVEFYHVTLSDELSSCVPILEEITNALYRAKQTPLTEELETVILLIKERAFGEESPQLGVTLNRIGTLKLLSEKNEQAFICFRHAYDLYETAFGSDHPLLTFPLQKMAALLEKDGKPQEAEQLFLRALAIEMTKIDLDAPEKHTMVELLRSLNRLASARGQSLFGVEWFDRADNIDIGSKLSKSGISFGAPTEGAHASLKGHADFFELPRFQIEEILEKLRLPGQHVGRDAQRPLSGLKPSRFQGLDYLARYRNELSTTLASCESFFHNFGNSLISKSQPIEAGKLYALCVMIQERTYGPEHPKVADSYHDLGFAMHFGNENGPASTYFKRAFEIYRKSSDPNAARPLVQMGDLGGQVGTLKMREKFRLHALALKLHTYGPDHPEVRTSLGQLEHMASVSGESVSAIEWLRRAREIDVQTIDLHMRGCNVERLFGTTGRQNHLPKRDGQDFIRMLEQANRRQVIPSGLSQEAFEAARKDIQRLRTRKPLGP